MKSFVYDGRQIECAGFLGLGCSNIGVAEYLKREFPDISLILRSDNEIGADAVGRVNFFNEIYCGDAAFSNPHEDIIFVSPSARRDRHELISLRGAGIILSSDAELFFRLVKIPVFAISGSDGKSTTTALAQMMLTDGSRRAAALGNIGVAMTPYANEQMDFAVCELSSFQLMSFEPSPTRALITNISPNHLDWHTSFREYSEAKKNLLWKADERVLNLDCPVCRELATELDFKIAYSARLSNEEMRDAVNAEVYICIKDGKICANGAEILDTGAIKCSSRHNTVNFMAAIALTYGYVNVTRICEVASTFSGLRSRCESIGCFAGVNYIDSSIDSTPKRTVTTLESLSSPAIVIIGGRSKGTDYSELIPTLKESARAVVLTGETGAELLKIIEVADDFSVPYSYISDFDDAVRYAASIAGSGDTVVLSPASTSFDRFKNYVERSERFRNIVKNFTKK